MAGYLFGHHMLSVLRKDVFVLGVTDAVMFGATFVCVGLQKAVWMRWIDWNSWGWILQHVHFPFPFSPLPPFLTSTSTLSLTHLHLEHCICITSFINLCALFRHALPRLRPSTSQSPSLLLLLLRNGFIDNRSGKGLSSPAPSAGPFSANGTGPKQSS